LGERPEDITPDAITRLLLLVLVPATFGFHPFPQSSNGVITPLPVFHFDPGSVGKRVVRRAVVTNTVRHGLDQDGFAAVLQSQLARFLCDFPDCPEIVAVHTYCLDTVA